MLTRARAMSIVAVLAASIAADGSLARDAKRAERIAGDDDPIMVPASVDPAPDPRLIDRSPLDIETTGSVGTAPRRRRCARLAWFPERRPEERFRPAC